MKDDPLRALVVLAEVGGTAGVIPDSQLSARLVQTWDARLHWVLRYLSIPFGNTADAAVCAVDFGGSVTEALFVVPTQSPLRLWHPTPDHWAGDFTFRTAGTPKYQVKVPGSDVVLGLSGGWTLSSGNASWVQFTFYGYPPRGC